MHFNAVENDLRSLDVDRGEDPNDKSSDHLVQEHERQTLKSRIFTTMRTGDLGALGGVKNMFYQMLHLPEGAHIASAYIENGGVNANLTVYEGPGGAGRIIGKIKSGTWKRIALSDGISSISVVTDVLNDLGLVIVVLTTRLWTPATGTL